MTRSDEVQAAYFQLLRAREELDDLRRYEEHLATEAGRLRAFLAETRQRAAEPPARVRRALRPNDLLLERTIEQRLRLVADERRHLPARIEAADAFVVECEVAHDRLRQRR